MSDEPKASDEPKSEGEKEPKTLADTEADMTEFMGSLGSESKRVIRSEEAEDPDE